MTRWPESTRSDEGGHLLFRPVGLIAVARAFDALLRAGWQRQDAIRRLARIPMELDTAPWAGVIWDPRRTVDQDRSGSALQEAARDGRDRSARALEARRCLEHTLARLRPDGDRRRGVVENARDGARGDAGLPGDVANRWGSVARQALGGPRSWTCYGRVHRHLLPAFDVIRCLRSVRSERRSPCQSRPGRRRPCRLTSLRSSPSPRGHRGACRRGCG